MSLGQLDLLIQLSRNVLDRMERGDELSDILPQARAVAEMSGNKKHVHWLDFEIYGVGDVPGQATPLRTVDERQGFQVFWDLHAVEDARDLTVDEVSKRWTSKADPETDKAVMLPSSISGLERMVKNYQEPDEHTKAFAPDTSLQFTVLHSQHQDLLQRVRNYLHRFVSDIWLSSIEEKSNQQLLGPDYRIVINSLDALETGVGQELLSALGLIKSLNPADWSAAALVCRNVILKLGRTLFPAQLDTYQSSLAGKTLNLKGEKELNRLCAFIDCHWRQADDPSKRELERLDELARLAYGRASQGKRGTELRHADAQQLVVDTFDLVSSLGSLVGFEPVEPQLSDAG